MTPNPYADQYASLPLDTSLDILGRTAQTDDNGYYWVYVSAQHQGRAIYGWVRADLTELNGTKLSDEFIESLGVYR